MTTTTTNAATMTLVQNNSDLDNLTLEELIEINKADYKALDWLACNYLERGEPIPVRIKLQLRELRAIISEYRATVRFAQAE